MVQSQLSAYSGSDPIWGFVALVRSELFTGEAAVGLDPRVRLFAVEGHIYFAEREDDAPVGTRLVNCGAISANQLARGAVHAGGNESLARLFQRDVTIDRDAVELTVASSTESLLAAIAANPVGMPEVSPLRHHSAGLHHWLRALPTLAADDSPVDEIVAVEPIVVPEPVVAVEPIVLPEPIVLAEPVAVPEPILVEQPAVAETHSLPALRTSFTRETPTETAAEAFPAPIVHAEPTVPEWPRVDDEPVWAVPADARELTPTLDPPIVTDVPAVALSAVPINAAELPHLPSLSSIQIPPSAPSFAAPPASVFQPAPPSASDPALPKLASSPMSVAEIKNDLKNAATASEPWTSSAKNMAAVQIWEMVDVLVDDGTKQQARVGGGAPQVRTRGWLRKKG